MRTTKAARRFHSETDGLGGGTVGGAHGGVAPIPSYPGGRRLGSAGYGPAEGVSPGCPGSCGFSVDILDLPPQTPGGFVFQVRAASWEAARRFLSVVWEFDSTGTASGRGTATLTGTLPEMRLGKRRAMGIGRGRE